MAKLEALQQNWYNGHGYTGQWWEGDEDEGEQGNENEEEVEEEEAFQDAQEEEEIPEQVELTQGEMDMLQESRQSR